MKHVLVFLAIVIFAGLLAQDRIDPRYHTYDEIIEELYQYEADYPEYAKVHIIGYATGAPYYDPDPIYALKISDNVEVDEDEPAVLYLGQVHAEEVLGVEVAMYMIDEILTSPQSSFNIFRNNLEIWVVPTYNPFGLGIVHSGIDNSWRKNGRDNNENGEFDYDPGVGGDIDGVDNNRNYSFNWIHGDVFGAPGNNEYNDYYRGPAPFSEGENQAIRDLAAQQHFIYSIAWHSSRTGNFAEKVFYSFKWGNVKYSPDHALNSEIANTVAGLIEAEEGGFYEPSGGRGRKGSAHDWFYKAHGTTQLLIECGTENLQPGEAVIEATCEHNSVGGYWLMNRTLGYQADAAMLTGHVTDADTGEPIVAEVVLPDYVASFFEPRLTDILYGRYWRQVQSGCYTVTFQKKGYISQTMENVVVNSSVWTTVDAALQPKAAATVSGVASADGTDVTLLIYDLENDTLNVNGNYSFDYYEGPIKMWAIADGFVPKIIEMELTAGENNLDLDLDSLEMVFLEDWENGLANWAVEGDWAILEDSGNNFIDDSPEEFYVMGQDFYLTHSTSINLNGTADDVMLMFDQKYYVEHDYDFVKVQVSTNGASWDTIAEFTGVNNEWHNHIVSLADYMNDRIYLRFVLESDDTLDDPGWKIDNIKIVSSLPADADNETAPSIISGLYANYPNPFNPVTNISFGLSESMQVNLDIYNIRGQKIKTLIDEPLEAGLKIVEWNGTDDSGNSVSSGIYFYRLNTHSVNQTRKMILMK